MIFDLETQRGAEEVGAWANIRRMGVAESCFAKAFLPRGGFSFASFRESSGLKALYSGCLFSGGSE